jgi:hypothetical protein
MVINHIFTTNGAAWGLASSKIGAFLGIFEVLTLYPEIVQFGKALH